MDLHAVLPAVLGSVLVLIASKFLWKLKTHRQRFQSLPKPPHSFLFGHIGLFAKAVKQLPGQPPFGAAFSLIQSQFSLPDVFYIDLWPFLRDPFLVTTNLDVADRFLDYRRHPIILEAGLQPLVGGSRGLISPHKSEWHESRISIRTTFSGNNVIRFVPVMAEFSMQLREELLRRAVTNRRFPLIEAAEKWAADVTFCFLLGHDTAVQQGGWGGAVSADVKTIVNNVHDLASWNPWVLGQKRKVRRECQERVRAIIRKALIEALKRNRPTAENTFSPLLDVLAAKYRKDNPGQTEWDADAFIQHLDTVTTLLLASDVSSMFVYSHIAQNPVVAAELRREHSTMFPRDVQGTMKELRQNPSKVRQLPYTTAVIKESLRLHPPEVAATSAPKGHTINHEGTEHSLYRALLYVNMAELQSGGTYVPDRLTFDPTRWLPSPPADLASLCRPFRGGQHSCMGENLMMPAIVTALVLTVRDMDLSLAYDEGDVALSPEFGGLAYMDGLFSAKPAQGLPVTVKVVSD
ncbi:hypothetical protein E4U30_000983 [Claviceps sp. LM220 group G6]|nr:hypothetical protein E4U15_007712 [Claviceps sp. LM218 group G6]KAG6097092.1 hypothetical protein E4U30_000983 [Claviceps sp. LM220 group G6]KAG6112190.1 hypothetical protein E4U31_003430 [Claviceps sp. LM219 group G6]